MIRRKILDCFKGTGAESKFAFVLKELKLDRSQLIALLHSEPPLDDLAGLTLEEASQVVKQFEGQAIFGLEIEKAIVEFNQGRRQIRDFEKRARDAGSSGGTG